MEEDYEDDNELLAEDDMDLDEKGKLTLQSGDMDIDGHHHQRRFSDNNKLVKSIGIVVRDLRNLGLTSMVEDAYASAIFLLLKVSCLNFNNSPTMQVIYYIFEYFQQLQIVVFYKLLKIDYLIHFPFVTLMSNFGTFEFFFWHLFCIFFNIL